MDWRERTWRIAAQLLQFLFEDGAAARVLVAQVNPDLAHAGAPGSDQHAFQEAVRIALEVPAVLEGAGFALVDVDRHHARFGLGGHEAPLAPGRKPRAAQTPQAGVFHDLGKVLALSLAVEAVLDQPVAPAFAVLHVIDVFLFRRSSAFRRNRAL